jgi:hypothetical protein
MGDIDKIDLSVLYMEPGARENKYKELIEELYESTRLPAPDGPLEALTPDMAMQLLEWKWAFLVCGEQGRPGDEIRFEIWPHRLPRDGAYWAAYHHAVDQYQRRYFEGSDRRRGRPSEDLVNRLIVELKGKGLSDRKISEFLKEEDILPLDPESVRQRYRVWQFKV